MSNLNVQIPTPHWGGTLQKIVGITFLAVWMGLAGSAFLKAKGIIEHQGVVTGHTRPAWGYGGQSSGPERYVFILGGQRFRGTSLTAIGVQNPTVFYDGRDPRNSSLNPVSDLLLSVGALAIPCAFMAIVAWIWWTSRGKGHQVEVLE